MHSFALVANMDKQWSWNKVYFPAILVVGIGMLTARCEPTLLMAFLPQRMEMLKLLILGLEPHLHLLILVQHCLHQSQIILTPSELLADLTVLMHAPLLVCDALNKCLPTNTTPSTSGSRHLQKSLVVA